MDFRDDAAQAAWRGEVRTFLDQERGSIPRESTTDTWRNQPEQSAWRRKMASRGWIAPAWPKEYGGAGLGVMEQFILNEEFAEASVPQLFDSGVLLVGPTLITHGTEAQKREHLSSILGGVTIWCQGFSEPGSGSDLASLQARAVKDGDDWVVNGQKIWTSNAHEADWIFLLVRTDPDAPKHRGISMFVADMRSPGITVRPLVNLANRHGFNETFFEDVRIPAANMVGELNRGWYVSTTTLDFERSAVANAIASRKAVEDYLRYFREHRGDGTVTASGPVRAAFADRWIEANTAKQLSVRVATMQARGMVPNYEASIAKLFNSELSQRIVATAVRALGTHGLLRGEGAPMRGKASAGYLGSVAATIGGGTSEIQRNIVATRGLGLPR